MMIFTTVMAVLPEPLAATGFEPMHKHAVLNYDIEFGPHTFNAASRKLLPRRRWFYPMIVHDIDQNQQLDAVLLSAATDIARLSFLTRS